MALTGGRHPYDPAEALIGPFNVLIADPNDVDIADVDDLYSIVSGIRDGSGIYQPAADWAYGGLAADAHEYDHGRETAGIEYDNVNGDLFEQVSKITRDVTVNFGSFGKFTVQIMENTTDETAIAGATNKAPQTKVGFGLYDSLREYRVALVGYRPDSSTVGLVREGVAGPYRPAMYAVVFPLVRLSTDSTKLSFKKGAPVSGAVKLSSVAEPTLGAGLEHGFHVWETPGSTIAIV